ncbi:hypothetical protein Tco_0002617 [Tanacetum coccineum]
MLCSACSSSFYTSSFAFSLTWDVLAVSVQYLQSNPKAPLYVLEFIGMPLKGVRGLSVYARGEGNKGRVKGEEDCGLDFAQYFSIHAAVLSFWLGFLSF